MAIHQLLHQSRRSTLILAGAVAILMASALLLVFGVRLNAQEERGVLPAAQTDLVINEFMASNATGITYPGDPSAFPDWVEIYNPGPDPVSLNGLSLSDTESNPARGPIPNGVTIPANGYYLLYPNEDDFLPFGLSADGEFVGLFVIATGELIDGYEFGPQQVDVSMGRDPNGSGDFVVMDQATPGRNNRARPPVFGNIARDIAVPASTDTPKVTATITDDGTVVSATLVYSSTGAADASIAMTKTTGNNWEATLPAFPDDTIVRYEIRAVDNESLDSTTRRFSYVVGYVAPVLFVNEIVASNNARGHEDIDDPGRFPDWAELYNPGDTAVSLDGLTLTDNSGDPTKYRIPNGKSVPAKGFLMLYLDEEPQKTTPTSKGIHASFALSADGEFLGIYGGEGAALIHGIQFGKQESLIAVGLHPDGAGTPRTLVCTTPGVANMLCDHQVMLPTTHSATESAPQ